MSFELTAPPSGAQRTAVLSACGQYRYELRRVWDTARPAVVFLMLNPSTADATQDDPTIRRCLAFAHRWGAGSLVVRNLFALRATDPRALLTHPDPVGPDNDAHLLGELGLARTLVAAWGAHPAAKGRAAQVEPLLHAAGHPVHCLGLTQDASPKHPLYVPAATFPRPYHLRS